MLRDIVQYVCTFAAGGVLGFYLCHRGFSGVWTDVSNIKTDVAVLKSKVDVQTQTPAI